MMIEEKVPIHLKVTMTIKEAAEYSSIGINKIDQMLRKNAIIADTDFDNEITIHFLCSEDLTQKFQAISSGLVTPEFIHARIIEQTI